MLRKNNLVLYKNQPAVVTELDGDKFTVQFCSVPATQTKPAVYATQKVREKDVLLLHDGAAASVQAVLAGEAADYSAQIAETYELLASDDETASAVQSFAELGQLVLGGAFCADTAWALYRQLCAGLEFEPDADSLKSGALAFCPRSQTQIAELKDRLYQKEHAQEIRAAFIKRLRQHKLDLPADAQFMQEVEALALGQTDKSKVLKDAGIKETPERAHKLLLDTGIWQIAKNPYPSRFGLSFQSASEQLASPPDEERVEVASVAYAIDNEGSTDPDDAVAFDGEFVWVHVADPASTVLPDSKIDLAARGRGATLYIPEGAARMLSESCLADYALGLAEPSRALSFRIRLDENAVITDCEVLKTLVHVRRLTYRNADTMADSPELRPLFELADKIYARRMKAGAVSIELPEVDVSVTDGIVSIEPYVRTRSSGVVRELMLLAGEAAAKFAFRHGISFPFVSQDAPDIPSDIPAGLAGQYRLRRCMRSRSVGVTPSNHAGLGLGMYSQVTSPLRRYADLVAHQQLRSYIAGAPLIEKDAMLERIAAGDAASGATVKAERKTRLHWTLVYLLQHPDWTGTAVVVELRGKQAVCLIPAIAQETLLSPGRPVALNDELMVRAAEINLPELTVTYAVC